MADVIILENGAPKDGETGDTTASVRPRISIVPGLGRDELLLSAVISRATSGDGTAVIAALAGKKTRVYGLFFAAASSVVVTLKRGSTALTGPMTLGALALDLQGRPWFTTAVAEDLFVNLGAAIQVSGTIYYTQEA